MHAAESDCRAHVCVCVAGEGKGGRGGKRGGGGGDGDEGGGGARLYSSTWIATLRTPQKSTGCWPGVPLRTNHSESLARSIFTRAAPCSCAAVPQSSAAMQAIVLHVG